MATHLKRMHRILLSLRRQTCGVTSIEYALIASLIAIGITIWATTIGTTVSTFFVNVNRGL